MAQRRVVITGIGIVAPNGIGKDEFWRNLVAGKSAVERVFSFDASAFPCQVAAEVRDFSATDFVSPRKAKTMGRFSQFAVAATRLALDDAKLSLTAQISEQVGVAYGTSLAGVGDLASEIFRGFGAYGIRGIPAAGVIEYPTHLAAGHVAAEFKVYGPALSVSTNCCTGLDALYAGSSLIRSGKVKAILAGGCDAPIFPETFAAFSAFGALTRHNAEPQRASRPYDKGHDGIVLSEGGGTLVVEDLEFALARGARIYGEILGHGAANDAGSPRRHVTGRAMASAIGAALREAELDALEIDHINAHGCGLPQSDICDTNAFKRTFGKRAYQIPITSIKSMIGQPLAAAGIFQAAAACLSIQNQRVPPTINQETRDSQCDLDYVPNTSRAAAVNRVLINAQGVGGSHAALVIGRQANDANTRAR
jgi:3-oxoacyl-[acyl-carrier-protein] synthase II